MANISRVGVDPRSGAQLIEQSRVFNENGDRNNSLDIFYHFGTRLGSSAWVNPDSTPWVNVEVRDDNAFISSGQDAVDRDTGTNAFNTVDEDYNVRVEFPTANFNLTHVYVRGTNSNWAIEASNDGTAWSLLAQGTPLSLGDDYYSIAITNGLSYTYYRVRHNETGVTKSLSEIKFYGTWDSGDFSFSADDNSQYIYADFASGGTIYIPDALVESFPSNYYVVLVNNQAVNFSITAHAGNTTVINDNLGGLLKPNLQAFIIFDGAEFTINLQGGGATELTSKGQILTVDNNNDLAALNPGADNTVLVPDAADNLGLKYVDIYATFAGTDPNKLVQLDASSRLPAVDASLLTNLPIVTGSGSPLTTLGDIYVHNGTNNVRFPVGADNAFLLADSGAPEGLSWQLAPSITLLNSPTTSFSFNNQLLTSLAEPVSTTDAATKGYVDSVAAGLDPKASCRVATTDDLDTETGNTWTPAGVGVGATLVQTGVTTADIDGYTLQLNDRVLVKNQILGEKNGVYCVDDKTEILTKEGWKTYQTLNKNDICLTLNVDTGYSEWQSVRNVHVFEEEQRDLFSIEQENHSSLTTFNHRWPTQRYRYYKDEQITYRKIRTSETLVSRNDYLIRSAPHNNTNQSIYSDELVRIIAWFYTEGHIRKANSGSVLNCIRITQSHKVNLNNVNLIAEDLTTLFGESSNKLKGEGYKEPKWTQTKNNDNTVFNLNSAAGLILLEVCPDRIPSFNFLSSLTQKQLEDFIEISVLADGHIRKTNQSKSFVQKQSERYDAFVFACHLAGYSVSTFVGNCFHANLVKSSTIEFNSKFVKIKKYKSIVWCPETDNTTWFARRNNTYYFTGNTVTSVTTNLVLTRATDFDGSPTNEVTGGAFTLVEGGTTQSNTGWVVSNNGTVIIDTTPITFVQFSGAETYPLSQLSDVDDALSPSTTDLLSYNGSQWTSESTGTAIGDILRLVDVGGSAALPALDGSNLTNLTVAAGQGSPLTTKGDIYVRDNTTNARLPIGTDDEVLVADSTVDEGLAYKDVREISRYSKLVTDEGAIDKTTVSNEGVLDVLYFRGTLDGTDTWLNPWFRGLVTFYNGNNVITNGNWADQSDGTSQTASTSGVTIDLHEAGYLNPTEVWFKPSNNYNSGTLIIRGSNDFATRESGEILYNSTFGPYSNNVWEGYTIITSSSFRYLWFSWSITVNFRQIELYGNVTSSTANYTLKAEDEKATLRVATLADTSIVAPVGFDEGYYTFVLNRNGATIGVGSDGSSTILGVNQSHNIGDVLMITNIGSDTWISSALSNVLVDEVGELITYGANGVTALSAPTEDNQRLTSLNGSDTGLVWRAIEPPGQILFGDYLPYINNFSISSLDIIRYIGTERNTTLFTNPDTSGKMIVSGTVAGTAASIVDNSTTFLTFDGSDNITLEFTEALVRPTFIGVRINGVPSGTNVFTVQRSSNGLTWSTIDTFTIPDGGGGGLNLGLVIPDLEDYYAYFRLLRNNAASTGTSVQLSEIKMFGDVIVLSSGGIVTIDSAGERKILDAPTYPKELRYDIDNNELAWQGSEFYTQPSQALGVVTLTTTNDINNAPDDISEYLYNNNGNSNPAPSLLTVGTSFGASNILTVTDQSTAASGYYVGGTTNPTTFYIDLKAGNTLSGTHIGFSFLSSYSQVGFDVYGSNNGTSWSLIGAWTNLGFTSVKLATISDSTPYRYFRIERGTLGNTNVDAQVRELYFYGTYTNAGTIVETLATANMNRTNYLNLATTYQINIPNNTNDFAKGDYYKFVNTGLYNKIQITTDPAVTLFGNFSGQAKSIVIVNLDGDDDWLVIEESVLPYGQSINEETVAGDIVLDVNSVPIQVIEPGGSNRTLTLPDPPFSGMYYKIVNADAANYTIDIEETLGGGSVQTLDVNTPYVECHYSTQWIILN